MSSEIAIRARDISKHYVMFARPEDRLKQMIVPRLQRVLGKPPTRYYRDFAALSGVSFDIRRGETVGIIGRNGSGKSTLLQIICGTLQPTSGSIEVNGRIAALLELGAGFNPEFTGRENVYLNAAILGLSRAEIDARFESIARFADIGDFIEQPVKTYSSGMYVRLAFATAINVDPDILVVDEALAVGDEAFQRKCYARIEQIKERGGTILFVSHSAQTVVQLCDRALLIDAGEKILEGAPKATVSYYQRLINASDDNYSLLRANAGKISSSQTETETETETEGMRSSSPHVRENSPPADYFDSHIPTETVNSYEEKGASITDIGIITQNGRIVNVLRSGNRYIVRYRVTFHRNAEKISFGFHIRTPSGLALGGMHTSVSKSTSLCSINAGQTVEIQAEFTNCLCSGTYFISCGVRGIADGETELVLHHISDAYMFRIVGDYDDIATLHVYMFPNVKIRKI
jgi:lipopolysaccharide transport system ATP-binding protein